MEVTSNAKPLQDTWMRENGFTPSESPLDAVFRQAQAFQPDVLFVADVSSFHSDWIYELRQACPSIRLALAWYSVPCSDIEIFRPYDAVLSCVPPWLEELKNRGMRGFPMRHAFEPSLLNKIRLDRVPSIDFSFVGQIQAGQSMHGKRERILSRLVKQGKITIYSPLSEASDWLFAKGLIRKAAFHTMKGAIRLGLSKDCISKLPRVGKMAEWDEAPIPVRRSRFISALRSPVYGLEMFQVLRDSKMTFNCHIGATPVAANMRLFEATGVGTCLVTDWKPNMPDLFEPDTEVVTYRSIEECLEKIQWLMDHPAKQKEIAEAGQKRCLRDHTFKQRGIQFDEIIRSMSAL
jgi:hypothetical protein